MSAGPSPYLRRRGHAHDRRLLAEDALRVLGEPTERVHDVKIRAKKIREQIGSPRAVADVLRLGLRMFSEELRGVDDVLRDSVPLAPARTRKRTAPIRLVRLKLQRGVERKVRVDSGTTFWFRMRQGSDRDGAVRDAAALVDGEVRIGGPGISAVAKCGQVGQMRVTRWIEGDERAVQQSKFVSVQTAGAINVGRGKVSAGSRLLDAKVLRSQRDEGRTVERGVNVAGDSHEQIGALLILATRHRPDLEPNPLQGVILPAFGRGRKRRSGGKRMFGAEWPESVVHFLARRAIDSTYYFIYFFLLKKGLETSMKGSVGF